MWILSIHESAPIWIYLPTHMQFIRTKKKTSFDHRHTIFSQSQSSLSLFFFQKSSLFMRGKRRPVSTMGSTFFWTPIDDGSRGDGDTADISVFSTKKKTVFWTAKNCVFDYIQREMRKYRFRNFFYYYTSLPKVSEHRLNWYVKG